MKKILKITLFLIIFCFLSLIIFNFTNFIKNQIKKNKKTDEYYYKTVYVSITKQYFDSINVLKNNQNLFLSIIDYDNSKELEISIFKVKDYNFLIDYITVDKNTKYIKKSKDIKKIKLQKHIKKIKLKNKEKSSFKYLNIVKEKKINLNNGIWYFEIKNEKQSTASFFVIKSDFFISAKNGGNKLIFWGLNTKTKKPLKEGKIMIFNLFNKPKKLKEMYFNNKGISEGPIDKKFDIALYENNNQFSLILLNFIHINMYPLIFEDNYSEFKYYFKEIKDEVKKIILLEKEKYFENEPIKYRIVFIKQNKEYDFSSKNFIFELYKDFEKDPLKRYEFKMPEKGVIDGELKNLPLGDYLIKIKDKYKEKNCEEVNVFNFSVIEEDKNIHKLKKTNKINPKLDIIKNKIKIYNKEKEEFDLELEIPENNINSEQIFTSLSDYNNIYIKKIDKIPIKIKYFVENAKIKDNEIIISIKKEYDKFEKIKKIKFNKNENLYLNFDEKKPGRYKIKISAYDSRNNLVEKYYYIQITDFDIDIKNKKKIYTKNDDIILKINSFNKSDIFLTLEGERKVLKYEILNLKANSEKLIKIPINQINKLDSSKLKIIARKYDYENRDIQFLKEEITVLIEEKLINIRPSVNKNKDKINLEIQTTDYKNKPLPVNLLIWINEKNIFKEYEINKEEKNLKNFFYRKYYEDYDEENLKSIYSTDDFIQISGGAISFSCVSKIYSRIYSQEIIYWNHSLETDKDGKIKIYLKIPEEINKLNINIFGYNPENKIGQKTIQIKN